jgi:CO/xanthine dehydrogenase FAD-binding subunit
VKVVSARTLGDALAALTDATSATRLLAGGTDLMVELESGRTKPDLVVDVWKLDALRVIRETDAGLEIGALASCTDMMRSKSVQQRADILVEAARTVGATQIRNRATIGGNLGTASPAADLNPVLFALGARVRLISKRGARELAADEFVKGYRATDRALDEIISSVLIPYRPAGERRAFRKIGTRRAQAISKVVVAMALELDGDRARSVRVAVGSVADRTVLLPSLARLVDAKRLIPEILRIACDVSLRKDCSPRDDVRSTAEYRRRALENVLVRTLSELAAKP